MRQDQLLIAIQTHFPITSAPETRAMLTHGNDCFECRDLLKVLDSTRDSPLTGEGIRRIYQDMYCLTAKGWTWLLPHYLFHCVHNESPYTQTETEFLLYKLAPDEQFQETTHTRLGLLNAAQIDTLIQFVMWMREHPHWSTYCPNEIEKALQFLKSLR